MANLENLVFFSEKGIEIPMEKTYTITWEIFPNTWVANNFISNPKGHFLYDLPTDGTIPHIQVVVDDPGQIILCETSIKCTTDQLTNETTEIILSSAEDIILLNESNTYNKIVSYKRNRFTGQTEAEAE